MLPPFNGCRDRDLLCPGQCRQALAPPSLVPQGQTMAEHAPLLWASAFRGVPTPETHRVCFQDHSSHNCSGTPCFCRAWRGSCTCIPQAQCGWGRATLLPGHRSQAGSIALLSAPAQLQRLCSCSTTGSCAQALPVPQLLFSLEKREFLYKKVKENPQNLFCFQSTLLKKKK